MEAKEFVYIDGLPLYKALDDLVYLENESYDCGSSSDCVGIRSYTQLGGIRGIGVEESYDGTRSHS